MSTTMQYLRDCDKEASENGTAAWVTTVANERGEVLKGVLAASEDSEIFPVEYDVYRKDRNSQGGEDLDKAFVGAFEALYGKIFPLPMAILEGMLGRAPYDKSLPLRSPQKEQETTDQDNLQSTISASKTLFLKQEDNRPEATCTVQEVIVHDTEETLSEVPPTQADEWLTISLTRLTMEDRQQLLGQRLSEKHICDQHLLKEEFPLVDGFRDTNFSSCRPVPVMAKCIQMHHIGDHWAVSCTQEIKTGVTGYGSMYTTVGMSLRRQLVSLYKHHVSVDEGILPVTVIRAQRQETKISDRRTPTLTSQRPPFTDATICRLDDRSSPIISIRYDIWRVVAESYVTAQEAEPNTWQALSQEFDSATEEAIVGGTNSEQWTEAVTGISQGQLGEQQQEHLGHLDKKTLQDTAARHKRVYDITNSKTKNASTGTCATHLQIAALNPKCFALVRDVAEKYQGGGGGHINGQGKKREVRQALFEHLKGRAAEDQEMWL
ncbi:hypothetical protein Bbelb_050170 [Branchiostoma belcheri]|nr:hypothetical protein Bbelb_050170 [Branchiostoma belcheri]